MQTNWYTSVSKYTSELSRKCTRNCMAFRCRWLSWLSEAIAIIITV